MALPNLLHITQILVHQIDRAGTIMDAQAREPVQSAARLPPVQVPGQVRWLTGDELRVNAAGPTIDANGYVLFRYIDLTIAGITLQENDRIEAQGHLTEEVYITRLMPCGHYADQNGATMVKAFFKDRKPAKQRST